MEKRKKGGVYIDPFMFEDTDLEDSELITYAIIYGFTVHGSAGEFTATLEYLMHRTKKGKPATIAILQRLMEKGLLTRRKLPKGKSYAYRAIVPQKRREEPEEVVSDDEVKSGIESLYTDEEAGDNVVASNNHDGCFNEPCVVASVNHDGCVGQPINKKERKGEINNEIKKETPKKKEGEETGKKEGRKYLLSSVPYVNELIEIGYADKSDVISLEGVFSRLAIYPKEDVERVFYAFKGSLRPEDMAKGFSYFESFMREHLENEKGRNQYPRGNLQGYVAIPGLPSKNGTPGNDR